MNKTSLLTVLLTCILAMLTPVQAEQKQQLGDWDVHYIAFNSTFLTPEIASHYGIIRSKYNGLLNISVLKTDGQQAQKVALTGKATNLLGQEKTLSFKEVVDGQAVYYLATITFRHEEAYNFTVNIQQGNERQQLTFRHTFYVD